MALELTSSVGAIAVLGGLAHVERDLIRTRTAEGSGRVTVIARRDPPTPPDMRFSASGG